LYYNFAAESFLSEKLCSILHSIQVGVLFKEKKVCFLNHSLADLEGNVRTSSIAHWKACVQLPIRHN